MLGRGIASPSASVAGLSRFFTSGGQPGSPTMPNPESLTRESRTRPEMGS